MKKLVSKKHINANIAARGTTRVSVASKVPYIIYMAASRWDGVAGTDKHLVGALAHKHRVLWVDPPISLLSKERLFRPKCEHEVPIMEVEPGVVRLQATVLPGYTKLGIRLLTSRLMGIKIRSALKKLNANVEAIVLASALLHFPSGVNGVRVLYVTDDWLSGAALVGISTKMVHQTLLANVSSADDVLAVTESLSEQLTQVAAPRKPIGILANGCSPSGVANNANAAVDTKVAGLVGQLNERLDLDILEAVQAAGIPMLIIGPRTERQSDTRYRLDRLLTAENVTWLGQLPYEEISSRLATMSVGLTPYLDTEFNRASFPLKTLEYLAAGLPVVSTDLPSVGWLRTDLIEVATGKRDYVQKVRSAMDEVQEKSIVTRRREFAISHSWERRATQLMEVIER